MAVAGTGAPGLPEPAGYVGFVTRVHLVQKNGRSSQYAEKGRTAVRAHIPQQVIPQKYDAGMSNEKANSVLRELLAEARKPLNAMTLDRYEKLKQREENQQHLDIGENELHVYREFGQVMDSSRRLWDNVDSMAGVLKHGTWHSRFDEFEIDPVSTPAHRSEAHLQELLKEMREAKAYELKNSEYLAVMAGALLEIRAARHQSDLQQAKQNGFNKRMTWVAALLAIGSIATSIVM